MNWYNWIHTHTHYSNSVFMDSATKHEMLIEKAVEIGCKALAITEHGNILHWAKKKIDCEKAGLKYIHGEEFYVTATLDEKIKDNYHLCLYAKNFEGVKELNKLSSNSWNRKDNHYYYVPRISIDEVVNTSDNIIVSTACLGGILAVPFNEWRDIQTTFMAFLANNKHRCFLELQHHQSEEQKLYNSFLLSFHTNYGIPLIIGTDTHNATKELSDARKIMQKSKNIIFSNEDFYDLTAKTYDELRELYMEQGIIPHNKFIEAIENTKIFADMVEDFELDKSIKYPKLYEDSEEVFKTKISEGWIRRGMNGKTNREEYRQRMKQELEVYKQTGSIDYMLFEEFLIDFAHKNKMYQGWGRGSVNGSLIAYLLRITEMDSIKHKLNFFRLVLKRK